MLIPYGVFRRVLAEQIGIPVEDITDEQVESFRASLGALLLLQTMPIGVQMSVGSTLLLTVFADLGRAANESLEAKADWVTRLRPLLETLLMELHKLLLAEDPSVALTDMQRTLNRVAHEIHAAGKRES